MFNAFGCLFFNCLPAITRVSQNVRFRPEAQPRDVCWRPLQSHKTASALCFRWKNKQTQNEFAQHVIERSCSKRQERRVSCCPPNIHPGPHIPRLCLMWSFSASSLYFLRVPFFPSWGFANHKSCRECRNINSSWQKSSQWDTEAPGLPLSVQPLG